MKISLHENIIKIIFFIAVANSDRILQAND